ncbi:MAG: cobyrinate a,c-diamide synthase [Niameybacter sp.]|uniref:cobyrinate a,c-diamide synthase n=1 Tax=Niameybacter sp. TaxID=2033640 RepID=UPI002FCB3867
MNKRRLMIAGIGSGAGKTTLTCALLKHFYEQKLKVASFKCGPDYIDPMFHKEVLHTPSYNLDLYMMGAENCNYLLDQHTKGRDLALIEGVMGFYDGIGDTTEASSYELAQETQTPVVLITSCQGMGLSVVPMLQGFMNFKENTIKGVVLNGISEMSYGYYKQMIEKHTTLKVYGYLPRIEAASLESRHLGLVTAKEVADLEDKIQILYEATQETLDIAGLLELAADVDPLQGDMPQALRGIIEDTYDVTCNVEEELNKNQNPDQEDKDQEDLKEGQIKYTQKHSKIKIGIAKDKAFSFYYEDNLKLLETLGVELVAFSPLVDKALPNGIKGLLLGGGYPEVYAKQLAENKSMKQAMKQAIEAHMPCIAECGGFMYLQESLKLLDGSQYEMVGALKGEAFMTKRLVRFGYVELEAQQDTLLLQKGEKVKVHEFHYSDSKCNGIACKGRKANKVLEWECIEGGENLFAGYPHTHFYAQPKMAKNFVEACKNYKSDKNLKKLLPYEIEKESFRMIEEILGETEINPLYAPLIKRAIHTSADFEYVTNLCFSDHVVERAIQALKNGAHIVTDTQMAKAGINKTTLASFGGEVHCFVADEDVARRAKEEGTTRSAVAIEKAAELCGPLIFAIGNAPTALLKIKELIETGKLMPEVVIGVPVGFVNVVESKEQMMQVDVPYIIAKGRKGGSNIAAALCNALLYMAANRQI